MSADDSDWTRLNGYADGMLGEAEARALEARLAGDAALRGELERIRDLKAQLGRLRPGPIAAPRRRNGWVAAAGIAAALLVAVLLVELSMRKVGGSGWVERAEVLHRQLSGQSYVVRQDSVLPVVSTRHSLLEFQAPDLTASRLFLVDARVAGSAESESIAMHYRGMRGCRLTIVAIEAKEAAAAPPAPAAGMLARYWDLDGFHFAVIAEGMDAARFASIADYAESAITRAARSRDAMRTAMAERYVKARPCVAG